MLKFFFILSIIVIFQGCSTIATQSDDGKILIIKGSGSAKFENGAEISGGTWIPPFPKIELDN